ncbi:DNA primase [Flavobacterium sp.]|uniref:DNA primase n=1 Tax=Flavobacterium sp. TaxID=239 RepID=UPI00260A8C03|nr:DNA primase [Flavobacterium sp.]
MITKETIDKVYEAARVEEVIGDFVQLKRAGSNFKGLSPFSDERSPSFMVSPAKGIWKDFSSGKGGNAIAFLMEHSQFTYPEAIRFLAKKYNIEVEETELSEEDKVVANEKESLFLVSEFASKYFQDMLLNSEEGKAIALSYFKERGFTNDTIKKFSLGYSPNQWDALTKEALGKGYKLEFLEKTGLTIVGEDKQFDRFKGRVMFPIQSMSGRVLGFGGRILTNDKKAAKYLNSPESDLYHKSKVLYGIFHAKQAIAKQDNCYLVEGYTDVIQMHQAGIENVVSSSGTALTPDQIRLINRLTKNVTVLFDGDAAGLRASIRGIDLILEEGMNVRVCTFPDGEDPDSFAKKTPLQDLIQYFEDNSMDFIQFKASLLMKDAKNDPIKKADLIRDMVASISKIPDRIKREVYIKETSRIMDISEDVLFNTLAQLVKKDISDLGKKLKEEQTAFEVVKNENPVVAANVDVQYVLELKIIDNLLNYGMLEMEYEDLVQDVNEKGDVENKPEIKKRKVYEFIFLSMQEDETEFSNPTLKSIYNYLIDYFNLFESFDVEKFLMNLTPEISQVVTSIVMDSEKYTLANWDRKNIFVKKKEDSVSQDVFDTIIRLRWLLVSKIIKNLQNSVSNDFQVDNNSILSEIMDYDELAKIFSKKLGTVVQIYN